MAVGRVDHQDVDVGGQQRFRPAGHVAADTDRRRHPQAVLPVDGRPVEAGPQRTGAGQQADEAAGVVDHRGDPVASLVEPVERRPGVDPVRQRVQLP